MAKTVYKLENVSLDVTQFAMPFYRGVKAREFTIVQDIQKFAELKKEMERVKGVATLTIECSSTDGTNAKKRTEKFEGLRVLRVYRHSEQTCAVDLTDVRKELENWICKKDLNLLYRDGYLDGTRKQFLNEALEFLLSDAWHLFKENPLSNVLSLEMPDDMLLAGATLGKPLDEILSKFGLDLTHVKQGKLKFATKEDIAGKPIKGKYQWVVGGEPPWLSAVDDAKFRRAKKVRYYYKRRMAILAHVLHDKSTTPSGYLAVTLEQRYNDGQRGDEPAAARANLLTKEQLLAKYAPGVDPKIITDEYIGKIYMTENFSRPGYEALKRTGSAERDNLIRIMKRDWRELYEVRFANPQMSLGGFSDMRVGVLRRLDKVTQEQRAAGLEVGDVTGDVEPQGAVRGEWAEFLRVIHNVSGAASIEGASTIQNHLRSLPFVSVLPTTPFTAAWENEEANVIRLGTPALRDGNSAVLAKVSNADDMKIRKGRNKSLPGTKGGSTPRYWGWDVPVHSKAELEPRDAVVLLVGTQRLPNDQSRWQGIELDAFEDGDVELQEFEVDALPAVFDYVDFAGVTVPGGKPARDPFLGIGAWLNESKIREDAALRRELYKQEAKLRPAGIGIAAGIEAAVKEEIDGSIDSIVVQVEKCQVLTEISCGNLSSHTARQERARRRARERKIEAGGKKQEAV